MLARSVVESFAMGIYHHTIREVGPRRNGNAEVELENHDSPSPSLLPHFHPVFAPSCSVLMEEILSVLYENLLLLFLLNI